jgi:CRISPR-associated protein Csh1
MLELLEIFKKAYYVYGDESFIKQYNPFNGIYISINKDNKIDRVMDLNAKSKKDLVNTINYDWFKQRDFYSYWINSNKSVHSKKMIQSNNCYTNFLKRKSLPDLNPQYFSNLQAHFGALGGGISDEEDLRVSGDCYDRWVRLSQTILDFVSENQIGENINIKIFFDYDLEFYNKMSSYYFKHPRIFLDSKKTYVDCERLFGIPNFSSSFDSKKTFLKPSHIKYPSTINIKDAIILEKMKRILPYKKFYLCAFLKDMNANCIIEDLENKKLDMYLDIKSDNGTPVLINLEIINYTENKILFIDYEIVEKELVSNNKEIDIKKIRNIFDDNYCGGNLYKLCFSDDLNKISGINKKVKTIIKTYRNDLIDYFYKKHKIDISNSISKIINANIKTDLFQYGANNVVKKKLLLKNSFMKIFNRGVEVLDYKEILKEKVLLENQKIEDDDELCFVVGQTIYYLSYQTKSRLKTGKLYQPFLSVNKISLLKNRLNKIYEKYCYAININPQTKLNKAMSMITSYNQKQEKINKDILLFGLTSKNLLFEDKKKTKNREEDLNVI